MFQPLILETAARSEVGRRREINEDAFSIRPDLGLYLLVDGMGGHPSGEVAAAIAIEAIEQFFVDPGATWPPDAQGSPNDPQALLVAATKHANTRIRQEAELDPEQRGMGAAIVAVHTGCSGFCVAHVGHTRAYRYREGQLTLLTEDHTRLNEYMWRGLHFDAAERMPDSLSLSRALGIRVKVAVTVRLEDARPEDIVLLCTNGLYGVVSDARMAGVLAGRSSLKATADALLAIAEANGSRDDVTCVLLRWRLPDAPREAAAPSVDGT